MVGSSIYGEESNKFTNTLGDSVVVEIQETPDQTEQLLSEVYHLTFFALYTCTSPLSSYQYASTVSMFELREFVLMIRTGALEDK